MKILDGQKTASTLIELAKKHRNIAFAVAWASYDNRVFDCFKKHKSKIKHGVIGTHFAQTHWKVLDWCLKNESNVRFKFDRKANAVFHPKVYLFWTGSNCDLLIGSANLTVGGMTNNEELMIHISTQDKDADKLKNRSLEIVKSYWNESQSVTASRLKTYTQQWERSQNRETSSDGNYFERGIELLSWNWQEYLRNILQEGEKAQELKNGLTFLQRVREVFKQGVPFHKLDIYSRRALAGSRLKEDSGAWFGVDNGKFGYTRGAGYFSHVVLGNAVGDQLKTLGEALQNIPYEGVVTRVDYMNYVKGFQQALADQPDRIGLGVGARLITIKRPDIFIPFNSHNKSFIEQLLRIKPKLKPKDFERYWDEVIHPICRSLWYNSPKPRGKQASEIWMSRAAMLDVFTW